MSIFPNQHNYAKDCGQLSIIEQGMSNIEGAVYGTRDIEDGRAPIPGRETGKHTPGVNSKEFRIENVELDHSTFNPKALAVSLSTVTFWFLRITTPKLPSKVHMHQPMPNFSQDSLTSRSHAVLYFGGQ